MLCIRLAGLKEIYRGGCGGGNVDVFPQLDLEPNRNHEVSAFDSAVLRVVAVRRPRKNLINSFLKDETLEY